MSINFGAFVRESNKIEGILREPTPLEIFSTEGFTKHPTLKLGHVTALVSVYQPNAILRDRRGLNVRVGIHIAPAGSPEIKERLETLLSEINAGNLTPWAAHVRYEKLHPFTDGNGRSGRAIWLWQMLRDHGHAQLGFLHHFYYQTLQNSGRP